MSAPDEESCGSPVVENLVQLADSAVHKSQDPAPPALSQTTDIATVKIEPPIDGASKEPETHSTLVVENPLPVADSANQKSQHQAPLVLPDLQNVAIVKIEPPVDGTMKAPADNFVPVSDGTSQKSHQQPAPPLCRRADSISCAQVILCC